MATPKAETATAVPAMFSKFPPWRAPPVAEARKDPEGAVIALEWTSDGVTNAMQPPAERAKAVAVRNMTLQISLGGNDAPLWAARSLGQEDGECSQEISIGFWGNLHSSTCLLLTMLASLSQ